MTSSVNGVSPTVTTPATTSVDRPDQMNKDTFLQLLVAQLRYQDPSNPADSSQMMSQMAQFSQVEKLDEIATQNASLLALQRSSNAGALVGRTVTYTDDDGSAKTGAVSSVRLGKTADDDVAMVGGAAVPMGRITEIAQSA